MKPQPKPVHGMTGQKNATKPEAEKAKSHLIARVRRADKALWVRAAQNQGYTLSEWVIVQLNREAKG